jgi:hypothetical protein
LQFAILTRSIHHNARDARRALPFCKETEYQSTVLFDARIHLDPFASAAHMCEAEYTICAHVQSRGTLHGLCKYVFNRLKFQGTSWHATESFQTQRCNLDAMQDTIVK